MNADRIALNLLIETLKQPLLTNALRIQIEHYLEAVAINEDSLNKRINSYE